MFINSRIMPASSKTIPVLRTLVSHCSSRAPSSIILEKPLEEPVVILREEDNVDLIGPPDSVSNLRPVLRKRLVNETELQQKLRELQDATQAWNHKFWAKHNTNFVEERRQFINSKSSDCQLGPDEMSEFYKEFLDKYWAIHFRYNMDWYRRNFKLLLLACQVQFEKPFLKYF